MMFVSERTFAETAESYLLHGGESRYLSPIIEYFADRLITSIFPFDVKQMALTLYPSQGNATRNRQALTPARAVIYHGYERGWCHMIRIPRFKQERAKLRPPASLVWLHAFVRQCDRDRLPHLSGLVLFMSQTGARVSEAVRLRWPEVDLANRKALLLRTKTGTNSIRYMTDELVGRLHLLQRDAADPEEGHVFTYTNRHSVNERIKEVCRRAEITYKSSHVCGRKAFATNAIELGMDVRTVMEAGDWKSAEIFLGTYVYPKRDAGRVAADRFNSYTFDADL